MKPNSQLKPRLRQIAKALLARTKAGQVNWARPAKAELRYHVALPESRVVLEYVSPALEPDHVSLQLLTPSGFVVGALEADEPDADLGATVNATEAWAEERAEQEADWKLLQPLFAEVHRYVTGWDKVISDIEHALASQGQVGLPPSGVGSVSAVGSLHGAGSAPPVRT